MILGGTLLLGTAIAVFATSRLDRRRRVGLIVALATAGLLPVYVGDTAGAAIVPTVPLGTSATYAVLAGSAVTNTGPTVIAGSVGLSPGSAVSGFPPGVVLPPGTIDINPAAALAQGDLTSAYNNAAGRDVTETTAADLANLTLIGGVYAGPGGGALQLTGPLVLDGQGNPNSVFIFQTGSSLTTASSSTVTLINGAQECNVFWQVGSSATLGTSSVFRGNILALTSITVTTGVTVHGRALARTGAVTLDTDVFLRPTCDLSTTTTSTPTTVAGPTTTVAGPTTTVAGPTTTVAGPTTTVAGPTTTLAGPTTRGVSTTTPLAAPVITLPAGPLPAGPLPAGPLPAGPGTPTSTGNPGATASPGTPGGSTPAASTPEVLTELPRTGSELGYLTVAGVVLIVAGLGARRSSARRT